MKIFFFVSALSLVSAITLAAEPSATPMGTTREVVTVKFATVPQRPVVEVRIRGKIDDVSLRTLRRALEGAYPSRAVFIEERPDGGVTLVVL